MTDTNPKKKSLKIAKIFAFVCLGFLVLVIAIMIFYPTPKVSDGTIDGNPAVASNGTLSLDLENPQQRVFKPAKYSSMRKFVEESVSPNGQGYSSHWNDSTLIVINKVSEIVGNTDNDYDAYIRLTILGKDSIGVIISSSFTDYKMSENVYGTYMDEIVKYYTANN